MLVVLRLTIGWHFYSEGSKHLAEPHWSSEGFLRQAKGPLARYYQSVLPRSDYGLDAALHSAADAKPRTDAEAADDIKKMLDRWKVDVSNELKATRESFGRR